MRVESIRLRLLLVGPLRLVLGAVFLVAARAAGASYGATLVAGGAGAFGIAFIASNDPRAQFRRSPGEPAELPSEASVAPAWLHVVHAALPSTVGVSILAAVTVAFQPTLTALLGGVLVGMGLAALLVAYAVDDRLYLEPRKRELFRKVR